MQPVLSSDEWEEPELPVRVALDLFRAHVRRFEGSMDYEEVRHAHALKLAKFSDQESLAQLVEALAVGGAAILRSLISVHPALTAEAFLDTMIRGLDEGGMVVF